MNNRFIVILILFNFMIGVYAGMFVKDMYENGLGEKQEIPASNEQEQQMITSPYDRIGEERISVFNDKITIDLSDLQGKEISWATYADTKSMIPTIGKGCNGLEFIPTTPAEIHRGDMIAFQRDESLIIHRVVDIGADEQGWFVKTKGDNNKFFDEKVRFSEIKFVTFGIIC